MDQANGNDKNIAVGGSADDISLAQAEKVCFELGLPGHRALFNDGSIPGPQKFLNSVDGREAMWFVLSDKFHARYDIENSLTEFFLKCPPGGLRLVIHDNEKNNPAVLQRAILNLVC